MTVIRWRKSRYDRFLFHKNSESKLVKMKIVSLLFLFVRSNKKLGYKQKKTCTYIEVFRISFFTTKPLKNACSVSSLRFLSLSLSLSPSLSIYIYICVCVCVCVCGNDVVCVDDVVRACVERLGCSRFVKNSDPFPRGGGSCRLVFVGSTPFLSFTF